MSGNLRLSLQSEGLLDPAKLRAWTRERQQAIYRATATAMKEQGRIMQQAAQKQATSAFGGKRRAANSIRAKVFTNNQNKPPLLTVGSKIPWLGVHERGGNLTGKFLVPFANVRGKRLKLLIAELMRGGNAYFVTVGNHAILFAENLPEYASLLAPFKRAARQQGTVETRGKKGTTIKRGADIPIGTLTSSITVKRRLRLTETMRQHLPALARAIEKAIDASR